VAHWNGVGPQHRGRDAEARKDQALGKRAPFSRTSAHTQYVTDGRVALGTVELIDGRYVAVASTSEVVGSFDTLPAASRSLPTREGAS
jgi:hypothetical protein